LQPIVSRPIEKEEEEDDAPRLRRLTLLRDHLYKDESESESAGNYIAEIAEDAPSESSLSSEEHYELRAVHLAALDVQRIIDGCLDFHFCSRKRRSMTKTELVSFLKTTKYSLNCEKYINLLSAYNRHVYSWTDGRVACREFTTKEIDERVEATRERMKRKQLDEVQLLL
jgi:hypothetical protein